MISVLPYLDAVVREALRVYPPVPVTSRIATKDDVLPVEKTDRYGVVRDMIKVSKDDVPVIVISIMAMNHSKKLWGPDANEFRPERWIQIPEAAFHVPGIWGHLLTFIGGPRTCIRSRISLVETKAILFTLVRAFEFEVALAILASGIEIKSAIVQRPVLGSDPTNKAQLPLIRPVQKEYSI